MLAFMNRARTKRANGEDGFTLIELLVVVVILGILIAIAIPVYLNYRKSANDKAAQSDLRGAISTFEVCSSDGSYPTTNIAASTTAGSASLTGTMAGCGTTGAKISLSGGTSIAYYYQATTGQYIASTNNSGGTKTYCYASAAGGTVKQTTAQVAVYADACPA